MAGIFRILSQSLAVTISRSCPVSHAKKSLSIRPHYIIKAPRIQAFSYSSDDKVFAAADDTNVFSSSASIFKRDSGQLGFSDIPNRTSSLLS